MKIDDLKDWSKSPPPLPDWNLQKDSKALKEWRNKQGWTVTDLGKVLGVRHTQISQIETGKRNPSGSMRRLLQLLGIWKP